MEDKNELATYLEKASIFLLALILFLFPLFMLTNNTDAFTLPKQALLGGGVFLIIILFALKSLIKGQVIIRRTPFDIPVLLFTAATFISSVLAINKADSVISFVTLTFAVLSYFAITNTAKDKKSAILLVTAAVLGAAAVSILEVFTFLKIYLLPFAITKTQVFTPLGSLLDQVLYIVVLLPLSLSLAAPILRRNNSGGNVVSYEKEIKGNLPLFAASAVALIAGLVLSGLLLVRTPASAGGLLVLPYETGFQTAFAAISQDTGRVFQGFLFGSGYGTYLTDFTRFKPPAFNTNANIWNVTFFRSSSLALELLATTGIAGILTFIFLIFKIFKNKFIFSIMFVAIAASILLPFSFSVTAIFFILLGLASILRGTSSKAHSEGFSDVELQLVTLQQGLIAFDPTPSRKKTSILPAIILIIVVLITGGLGYFSGKYFLSDMFFKQSLDAVSQNNGSVAYQRQADAISMFKYRDAYYRYFSQINLALANSLASQQAPGASPSADTQRTILTLIQQSIDGGRSAATYGPQTMLNWQNLSSVYRSLIGFGQNADQFSILAQQQAVNLDPNNPQEYIALGGVYYQLGQWDNAIRQFQIAIALKSDLSNAYYNLGHAYQEKGDLNQALAQYQRVRELVGNDKPNLERINQEIDALQKRISGAAPEGANPTLEGDELKVSSQSSQLPPQNPPVKILGPSEKPSPTPTASKEQ